MMSLIDDLELFVKEIIVDAKIIDQHLRKSDALATLEIKKLFLEAGRARDYKVGPRRYELRRMALRRDLVQRNRGGPSHRHSARIGS